MEDRIQINGEWYVRAKLVEDGAFYKQEEPLLDPKNLVFSEELCYEDNDFSWTASRLYNEDKGTYFDDIDIKFTDKRVEPWKVDYWDGNNWFRNLLNHDEEAYDSAVDPMGTRGTKLFIEFLKKLVEMGWLKIK